MSKPIIITIIIVVVAIVVGVGMSFYSSPEPVSLESPAPSPSPEPSVSPQTFELNTGFHGGDISQIPSEVAVVNITDDGFEPKEVTVNIGTTVYFVNKSTNNRRPASAVHPSHLAYPGSGIEKCNTSEALKIFDACDSIKPGNFWAFTFGETGTWLYHDHLVLTTGTITVIDKTVSFLSDEKAIQIARQVKLNANDLVVLRSGSRIEVFSCNLSKIVEIDPNQRIALNIRDYDCSTQFPDFPYNPVIEDEGKLNVWLTPEVQSLVQQYGAANVRIEAVDIDFIEDIEFLKKLHPKFQEETGCIIVVRAGNEGYVYQEDKDLQIIYRETLQEFLVATKDTDEETLSAFYLSLH